MGLVYPEMSGLRRVVCRLIEDGLLARVRLRTGPAPGRWHVRSKVAFSGLLGWHAAAGADRASSADNNGPNLAIYRGRIDGNRLVYEPLQEALLIGSLVSPGGPERPEHATGHNESTVVDGQTLEPDRGIPDGGQKRAGWDFNPLPRD